MDKSQDAISTRDKIEFSIQEIENLINDLDDVAQQKANSYSEYDKSLAVTILKLKNGVEMELDGQKTGNLPATLIPIVAKGIIYEKAFDKEAGEALYKSLITKIDARKAILNGHQSISKIIS